MKEKHGLEKKFKENLRTDFFQKFFVEKKFIRFWKIHSKKI